MYRVSVSEFLLKSRSRSFNQVSVSVSKFALSTTSLSPLFAVSLIYESQPILIAKKHFSYCFVWRWFLLACIRFPKVAFNGLEILKILSAVLQCGFVVCEGHEKRVNYYSLSEVLYLMSKRLAFNFMF